MLEYNSTLPEGVKKPFFSSQLFPTCILVTSKPTIKLSVIVSWDVKDIQVDYGRLGMILRPIEGY